MKGSWWIEGKRGGIGMGRMKGEGGKRDGE
jgi:hypothetical protein